MGNYTELQQYEIQMVNTQCSFLSCPIKSKEWGFYHAWLKMKQCGEIR